jgi:hypothetical protein
MCSLEGKKCNTDSCYEVVIHTDSDTDLQFTYDARDADNYVLRSWFFATEFVDSIDIREVGSTVWSNISLKDWKNKYEA